MKRVIALSLELALTACASAEEGRAQLAACHDTLAPDHRDMPTNDAPRRRHRY
jgi:hypothetical protein